MLLFHEEESNPDFQQKNGKRERHGKAGGAQQNRKSDTQKLTSSVFEFLALLLRFPVRTFPFYFSSFGSVFIVSSRKYGRLSRSKGAKQAHLPVSTMLFISKGHTI